MAKPGEECAKRQRTRLWGTAAGYIKLDLAETVRLLTFYCLDPEVVLEPMAVKIDNSMAAVVAFKDESAAERFLDARRLNREMYVLRELTIDEFEKKRRGMQVALPGVSLVIQIEE